MRWVSTTRRKVLEFCLNLSPASGIPEVGPAADLALKLYFGILRQPLAFDFSRLLCTKKVIP
jgi:hypothetical protein